MNARNGGTGRSSGHVIVLRTQKIISNPSVSSKQLCSLRCEEILGMQDRHARMMRPAGRHRLTHRSNYVCLNFS